MPNTAARRQRQAEVRRSSILSAAARVIGEKGYAGATTKEIAAMAEISEGTIYRYFRSKHELLIGIVADLVPRLVEQVLRYDEVGDVEQQLVGAFERLLSTVCERRDVLRVLAGEAWRSEEILQLWVVGAAGRDLPGRVQRVLEGFVSSGQLRPLDTALGARLLLFSGLGVVLPIIRGIWPVPSATERHDLALSLANLLMHGMAAVPNPVRG